MKISSRLLTWISICYLYAPILLFLFGWTKLWIALVCVSVWVFCAVKAKLKLCIPIKDDSDYFEIDPSVVVFALLYFMWIGYYAGWGRFVDQSLDWNKHNAVLYDLVSKDWPVYYSNGCEHSMLVYYIGQYLVPATIGKLFNNSCRIAEKALYIWNVIGMCLVYLNIVRHLKCRNYFIHIFSFLFLVLFSVPLWLSELILKHYTEFNCLGSEQWFYCDNGIMLQYSSNYTLLRWVFPQTIPIWLTMILFLRYKNRIDFYVPMILPSILFGIFGFLGIILFACMYAIFLLLRNKNIAIWVQKVFSIYNISFLLSSGIIFILYYYGNVFSKKPSSIGFSPIAYTQKTIVVYFVFVSVNILLYATILWKYHKSDFLFYNMVGILLILPLFKMGLCNDLTMRTSVPALFLLMIYILEYVNNETQSKIQYHSICRKISNICIICLLLIGAYYPFKEFSSSVETEQYHVLGCESAWESLEEFANRSADTRDDIKYNYFAYDTGDNLFCKYISRLVPHY